MAYFFWQEKATRNVSSLTDIDAPEEIRILDDTYSFMASIVHELLCELEGMVTMDIESQTVSIGCHPQEDDCY